MRTLPAVLLVVLFAATPGDAARACAFPGPPWQSMVGTAPVVVRGEVIAMNATDRGAAILTIAVTETLKGIDAESWRVIWRRTTVSVPPTELDEIVDRYGRDVVLGIFPHMPGDVAGDPSWLAQGGCSEPFIGAFSEVKLVLRDHGLVE
jgi:hypothetical protein